MIRRGTSHTVNLIDERQIVSGYDAYGNEAKMATSRLEVVLVDFVRGHTLTKVNDHHLHHAFYVFKFACDVIAKGNRDVTKVG